MKGRILVADDNPANQLLVRLHLGQLGLESVVVSDGLEALVALDEDSFDAVILDGRMPGMGGVETLQAIRSRPDGARLPVLLFSASLDGEFGEGTADFDGFLSKPADLGEFQAVLGRVLGGAKMEPLEPLLERARLSQLEEVLGGADELVAFAAVFRKDALQRMDRMKQALSQGELRGVAGTAHDLKTNAGNLGLSRLSHLAMELEQASKKDPSGDLESRLSQLELVLAESLEVLEQNLPS